MFVVLVENRAAKDIQEAINYYNNQQSGLGKKFEKAIDDEFIAIAKSPYFQIRYLEIRCKAIKKFPYLIHFQVIESEKMVKVFAVINTSKNPKDNWLK